MIKKLALVLFLASPMLSHAYLGPGFGMGALATLMTLGSAAFFTLYCYIWLPVKRWLGLAKKEEPTDLDSGIGSAEKTEDEPNLKD